MTSQAFAGRMTVMNMLDSDRQENMTPFRSVHNKTYLTMSTEGW